MYTGAVEALIKLFKGSYKKSTNRCSVEEIAKQMKKGIVDSQRIPIKFAEKVHTITR